MDKAWLSLSMEEAGGGGHGKEDCSRDQYDVRPGSRNILFIVCVSLLLGFASFLLFCFWRPRWTSLYSARKQRLDAAADLPKMPDTFFGWIPVLYRVTEEQVLASAGLDAYVFLHFFKMALRILCIMTAFAAVVLTPINMRFLGPFDFSDPDGKKPHDDEDSVSQFATSTGLGRTSQQHLSGQDFGLRYSRSVLYAPSGDPGDEYEYIRVDDSGEDEDKEKKEKKETHYLWAYLVFTYFFSGLTIYIVDQETFLVLDLRQRYLAGQSTITDRTFRLSGFTEKDKSESQIVRMIEKLEIGRVERVTLCRDWSELDYFVSKRNDCLRKLERAWAEYHKKMEKLSESCENGGGNGRQQRDGGNGQTGSRNSSGERSRLLESGRSDLRDEDARPKKRLRYGFLNLRSRKVDAIDYHEEKLRKLDQHIEEIRRDPDAMNAADIAFVTMDSIAACQMGIQTLIDPRPGQLLTKAAPSPPNVVWRNTYADRRMRRAKRWGINILVFALSAVWIVIIAFLASLLSFCTIEHTFPSLGRYLGRHEWMRVLVQSGLPTVAVSLLNVSVPFLYDYLSHHQGSISRGQVELSFITKNFFFNFFNIFFVFAVSGSASKLLPVLWKTVDSTASLPRQVALSIMEMADFYISFIVLQGVGLLPFRLLEPGGISQYVLARFTAKTPRERLEAQAPPTFSYGYYLPTAILVFILCLVYSILQKGVFVLLAGVIYFFLGYYIYKYQLLYAMDDPQHATGEAWPMIAYRIFIGLFFFQLTMSGVLALQKAFWPAVLLLPLVIANIWYGFWYFERRYDPLTKYISLRSIRDVNGGIYDEDEEEDDEQEEEAATEGQEQRRSGRPGHVLNRKGSTIDEERERGMRFENPSLTMKLEQPWVYEDPPPSLDDDDEDGEEGGRGQRVIPNVPSSDSNVSLGDTHIWRS